MNCKKNKFLLIVIISGFSIISQAITLETFGPSGSSLITDEFGVISAFNINSGINTGQYIEYGTNFFLYNEGFPIEISENTTNLSVWDGIPADPGEDGSGYFLPNRFEDWSYDPESQNVWHTVLEYQNDADETEIMIGIGYKLLDPSEIYGEPHVDWISVYQFTNVSNHPINLKKFRYFRTHPSCSYTSYSNHGHGRTDYDRIDGTSDDVVTIMNDAGGMAFLGANFPISNYRLQSFSDSTSLYELLLNGYHDYDISNSVDAVNNEQSEICFQYPEITLQPGQTILYWLYPKPIKLNNTNDNYPIEIEYNVEYLHELDEYYIWAGFVYLFRSRYYDIFIINGQDECKLTTVFVDGGVISSELDGLSDNYSPTKFIEVFYDTRYLSSNAIFYISTAGWYTSGYNEHTTGVVYREDYEENWEIWDKSERDPAADSTRIFVDPVDSQWSVVKYIYTPINLSIVIIGEDVVLSWEWENYGNDQNHINIYRSENPYNDFELIYENWGDYPFTDVGAANGSKYFYYVRATD